MKIPLTLLALVAVVLLAFVYLAPGPSPEELHARTDLPWQITTYPDGTSKVFDLHLGEATLADAMAKFGDIESFALFEPAAGPLVLEAYFGNVQFGPLTAKIVVGLEAQQAELEAMRDHAAASRKGSPTGDWKYELADAPKVHAGRRLTVITYIPGTRNLDATFLKERFGKPDAVLRENEQAVSWFYAEFGLSILIDDEAREVFEYQPPRDFRLPVEASPPANTTSAG